MRPFPPEYELELLQRHAFVDLLVLAHLGEFLGRIEGPVGVPLVQQAVDDRLVDSRLLALGLVVGSVRAALADTLLPLDADVLKALDDLFLAPFDVAGPVRVLDAQDVDSAVVLGEEPGWEEAYSGNVEQLFVHTDGSQPRVSTDQTRSHGT